MFSSLVAWLAQGTAALRQRLVRSSVFVAYAGAVARVAELSARVRPLVFVLRAGCIGAGAYWFTFGGPLARAGFRGEALWLYDTVAAAVLVTALAYALTVRGVLDPDMRRRRPVRIGTTVSRGERSPPARSAPRRNESACAWTYGPASSPLPPHTPHSQTPRRPVPAHP